MQERENGELQPEDFRSALRELESYVDVSVDDLVQIHRMASRHARLREAESVRVGEIMTRDVTTVQPDTPLRDAARLLLELRISGLPVTELSGKLLGIVTEADFLSAIGVPVHHPAHSVWQTLEAMFRHSPDPLRAPERVADIMVRQVVTIEAEHNVHDAIDLMKRHHVKRLIVVNDTQHVTGIITRSNLVKMLLKKIL